MYCKLSVLFFFLLIISSCNKKDNLFSSNGLPGKWEYIEHYYSTGGPGVWEHVQPAGQIIEFGPGGNFVSVASFSETFRKYEIIDSAAVKFSPAPTNPNYVLMHYNIDSTKGTLQLYPIQPMCIEGCSYKFRRAR